MSFASFETKTTVHHVPRVIEGFIAIEVIYRLVFLAYTFFSLYAFDLTGSNSCRKADPKNPLKWSDERSVQC